MPRAIFLPALAMVTLTAIVWGRMFVVRIGEMKRERIHPQSVATSAQIAARLSDTRASDNFRNLFELPVLFYLALCLAAIAGLATTTTLLLAWLFVILRVAHSAIQCTVNKVMHRFQAYLASSVVLWMLWAWIGYLLLR